MLTFSIPNTLDAEVEFDLDLHRRLARWNRARLSPSAPSPSWRSAIEHDARMKMEEGAFIESMREIVGARAGLAPIDAGGFVDWFVRLREDGPGQGDPLFPWLAQAATLEEMDWFLTQEVGGEAGFDDLVALTQVKMPTQAKLELARNYWDEMGQGRESAMHGPMLSDLADARGLSPSIEHTLAPALALGNAMIAFATSRRYAYHAIGALGVVELTAPGRAALVDEGLRRLNVGPARRYFAVHATLDVKHSEDWNREILYPIVADRPEVARFIAEGALIRLACGARCFEAYRKRLWGGCGRAN